MELMDIEMQGLVAKAKAQGYLTYEDVNRYLPDEDVSSEKLDNLLVALERLNVELVDAPPANSLEIPIPAKAAIRCSLARPDPIFLSLAKIRFVFT